MACVPPYASMHGENAQRTAHASMLASVRALTFENSFSDGIPRTCTPRMKLRASKKGLPDWPMYVSQVCAVESPAQPRWTGQAWVTHSPFRRSEA